MKIMIRMFLLISCLSTIITAQIKSKNTNGLIKNSFLSREKFQQPEDMSIKNIESEIQKICFNVNPNTAIRNSQSKNKLAKTSSALFKPAKITLDSMINTLTYNDHGNLLSEEVEVLKSTGWEKSIRYTYTIKNDGLNQDRLQEVWKNDRWVNIDRYSVTNDENRNGIEEIYEVWNDSTKAWENVNRYSTFYSNSQRPDSRLYENWSNGTWVNDRRYNYRYDESGNTIETQYERWINNSWNPYLRYSYTFDNSGNTLTQSLDMWFGNIWICMAYAAYTYDDMGNVVSGIGQRAVGISLQNAAKFTFTYDTHGNVITEIYENWTGTDWVYSNKISFTYDNSNNCLSQVKETRADTVWINSDKHTYTYDASGNQLSDIYGIWADSSWRNIYKGLLGYDSYGNGNHAENYEWQDSAWVPVMGDIYLYYNNHKDEIYIYSLNADVEYIQIQPQTTDIKDKRTGIVDYNLSQNYPNPFNPSTRISYSLPKESFVTLKVFNSLGQEISTLVNEPRSAGKYTVEFNANEHNLPSGVYFYKLITGEYSSTKKFILLK